MEPAQDFSHLPQASNPHCFELLTAVMVYYVGEENGGLHNPALAASGIGREVARGWERSIRQAMMPVTPKASVGSGLSQGKEHSEYLHSWWELPLRSQRSAFVRNVSEEIRA